MFAPKELTFVGGIIITNNSGGGTPFPSKKNIHSIKKI